MRNQTVLFNVGIAVLIVFAGCDRNTKATHRLQSMLDNDRVYFPVHDNCPIPSFSQYSDYVVPGSMDLEEGGDGTSACFDAANTAEWSMCNAQEYLAEALSFSPVESKTREERLFYLRGTNYWLYHATIAASSVHRYNHNDCEFADNPTYYNYMGNILAEIPFFAEMAAVEGTRLAVGLADDAGQVPFSEKVDWIWGEEETETPGKRAIALSYLLGRPWAHFPALTFENGDVPGFWDHEGYTKDVDIAAVLPTTRVKGDKGPVRRASHLLKEFGISVYTDPLGLRFIRYFSDSQLARDSLTYAVNKDRAESGLSALSYSDILDLYKITTGDLDSARDALVQESTIYLSMVKQITDGGYKYIRGFGSGRMDIQQDFSRAFSGAFYGTGFRAWGIYMPTSDILITLGSNAGLQPLFSLYQSSVRCLAYGDCDEVAQERGMEYSFGMSDILAPGLEFVEKIFGDQTVTYKESLIFTGDVLAGRELKVDISETGLNGSDVRVYRVLSHLDSPGEFKGITSEYYELLSCIYYDQSLWKPTCQHVMDEYHTGCYLSSDNLCTIELDNFKGMVVVVYGDEVVDVYAERRPSVDIGQGNGQASFSIDFWSRHFIGDSKAKKMVGEIIERRHDIPALPKYNSLGLTHDMPVPLENELTQGTTNTSYENSYVYYIDRAERAAINAGEMIQRAWGVELDREAAEVEITNLQIAAVDRIEQICGADAISCMVNKVDRLLHSFDILPSAGAEDCENAAMPNVSLLTTKKNSRVNKYFRELEKYIRCTWQDSIDVIGDLPLVEFPEPIANAVDTGMLGDLMFQDYGGEYRIRLLEMKKYFLDLQMAIVSTNANMESFVMELVAAKKKFQAMVKRDRAGIMQQINSGLKGVTQGVLAFAQFCYGDFWGGSLNAVMAVQSFLDIAQKEYQRTAARLEGYAQHYQFLAKVIHALYAIEQTMISIQKGVTGLTQESERLKMLELEQDQETARAERMANQLLAKYVGDSEDKVKAYRKMTLFAQIRARRSVFQAKKFMYIARRAMETKLVVDMSDEKDPGIIGDPPARWADRLYSLLLGVDLYGPIEDDESDPAGVMLEYSRKLEDFVYNYPFQYPFADSSDTAVISLRDDMGSYGEECIEIECTKNIVQAPEDMDEWISIVDPLKYGRVETEANVGEDPFGNENADMFYFYYDIESIHPNGKTKGKLAVESPEADGIECEGGYSTAYTGSIYLKPVTQFWSGTKQFVDLSLIAEYRLEDNYQEVLERRTETSSSELSDKWTRYSVVMDGLREPDEDEIITFRLEVEPKIDFPPRLFGNGFSLGGEEYEVKVLAWGAQIEAGTEVTSYQTNPIYAPAKDEEGELLCNVGMSENPWTGDTEEIFFYPAYKRSQRLKDSFMVKCVFDDFAIQGQSPEDCMNYGGVDYLEKPFSITLASIESGRIIQQGQIGAGNYNYRISGLAVNLVGSNIKDCTLDPEAGTTCYANMFIPYDLIQDGVVRLRDHSLTDHKIKLDPGRIHQVRLLQRRFF